jgi:hypothetical protein
MSNPHDSRSLKLPHDDQGKDPAGWTPVIEHACVERLLQLLGSAAAQTWPKPVHELVAERRAVLEEHAGALVHNSKDVANVRFTALAVAAYAVLEPVCGSTQAASIVDDCLNSPLREQILAATRTMLDEADDPSAVLVATSKDREESYVGPSFRFQRPLDDHNSYVLDVPGCLFHEALVCLGYPELQSILCRFDLNWANAIDPQRHHVRFVRPVTFASATTCRMAFTREEHLPGLVVETPTGTDTRYPSDPRVDGPTRKRHRMVDPWPRRDSPTGTTSRPAPGHRAWSAALGPSVTRPARAGQATFRIRSAPRLALFTVNGPAGWPSCRPAATAASPRVCRFGAAATGRQPSRDLVRGRGCVGVVR